MELTREKVLAMSAGIEMDSLLAIIVMGWEIRKLYEADQSYHEYYFIGGEQYENVNYPDHWQPSKYIDAAWKVVEKLKQQGLRLHMAIDPDYTNVDVIRTKVSESMGNGFERIDGCTDTTTELAICRVALLATLKEE